MAQVGKGEFDQLRELLGMTEPVPPSKGRTGPSGRSTRIREVLASVAPWKLAVSVVLLVVAVGLAAALLATCDAPEIVVRHAGQESAQEGSSAADNPRAGEEGGASGVGPDVVSEPEEPQPAIYVHVAGAVLAPGVYELSADARVNDAVSAAGGLRPDAQPDALNLASPLTDGAKVLVPCIGEEAAPPAPGEGEAQAPPGLVDINAAGADELQTLPGIGPSLAAAIIEDRGANGPFASPEELMRVSGIGEKKFARLSGLVAV